MIFYSFSLFFIISKLCLVLLKPEKFSTSYWKDSVSVSSNLKALKYCTSINF